MHFQQLPNNIDSMQWCNNNKIKLIPQLSSFLRVFITKVAVKLQHKHFCIEIPDYSLLVSIVALISRWNSFQRVWQPVGMRCSEVKWSRNSIFFWRKKIQTKLLRRWFKISKFFDWLSLAFTKRIHKYYDSSISLDYTKMKIERNTEKWKTNKIVMYHFCKFDFWIFFFKVFHSFISSTLNCLNIQIKLTIIILIDSNVDQLNQEEFNLLDWLLYIRHISYMYT